jgi:hypothetical protein
MLNVRKLAALDMHFPGTRLILPEFAVGAVAPIAIGVIRLHAATHQGNRPLFISWGLYMLGIGINDVPLLLHASAIAHLGVAEKEIGDELRKGRSVFRKYRRQSLWILVPIAVLVFAIIQAIKSSR